MSYEIINLSPRAMNLTDKIFGKLTAIRPIGRNKHRRIIWLCKCECGGECTPEGTSLTSGNTTSCGCNHTGRYIHGYAHHPMYKQFHAMHQRCENPNNSSYHKYGARGIKVCKRWKEFPNFLSDVGERPEGKSIDRINNNGDYTPKNCKWSTPKEQSRNGRHNHMLTLKITEPFFNLKLRDGEVQTPKVKTYLDACEKIINAQYKKGITKCIAEWADITGIPEDTIRSRKRLGWSDYKTLTTPMDWLTIQTLIMKNPAHPTLS